MSYSYETFKNKLETMTDKEFEQYCRHYFGKKQVLWYTLTNVIGLDFLEAIKSKDYTYETLTKLYREKLTRHMIEVEAKLYESEGN